MTNTVRVAISSRLATTEPFAVTCTESSTKPEGRPANTISFVPAPTLAVATRLTTARSGYTVAAAILESTAIASATSGAAAERGSSAAVAADNERGDTSSRAAAKAAKAAKALRERWGWMFMEGGALRPSCIRPVPKIESLTKP